MSCTTFCRDMLQRPKNVVAVVQLKMTRVIRRRFASMAEDVDVGIRERPTNIGESQVTALELGEAHHLQRLSHREQLVDLHLQLRGDDG